MADVLDGRLGGGVAAAIRPNGKMAKKLMRRIGGKMYKRYPKEEIVARNGRWILVLVPEWSRDGWDSYKLFYDHKFAKKRVWHLAHKAGRITGGVFITHLEKHYPEALIWAREEIMEVKASG